MQRLEPPHMAQSAICLPCEHFGCFGFLGAGWGAGWEAG